MDDSDVDVDDESLAPEPVGDAVGASVELVCALVGSGVGFFVGADQPSQVSGQTSTVGGS